MFPLRRIGWHGSLLRRLCWISRSGTTGVAAQFRPTGRRWLCAARAAGSAAGVGDTGSGRGQAAVLKRMPALKNVEWDISELREATAGRTLVIGLDVNTNSTGYNVVRASSGALLQCGVVDTSHVKDVLDIVDAVRDTLCAVRDEVERAALAGELGDELGAGHAQLEWVVSIETFLKTYGMGKFHTKGLFLLAEVNAAVTYMTTGVFPQHRPLRMHPNVPRTMAGLKKPKGASRDAIKAIVYDYMMQRLGLPADHAWMLSPSGLFSKSNYDISDSYIVALAGSALFIQDRLLQSPEALATFSDKYRKAYLDKHPKKAEAGVEFDEQGLRVAFEKWLGGQQHLHPGIEAEKQPQQSKEVLLDTLRVMHRIQQQQQQEKQQEKQQKQQKQQKHKRTRSGTKTVDEEGNA